MMGGYGCQSAHHALDQHTFLSAHRSEIIGSIKLLSASRLSFSKPTNNKNNQPRTMSNSAQTWFATELKLAIKDVNEVIQYAANKEDLLDGQKIIMPPSSFVLEKHLEDYICRNWETTIFGGDFNIYENGRQYQTNTGPLDILAKRKDETEFLILELKRDLASDAVVGQTLNYMGWVMLSNISRLTAKRSWVALLQQTQSNV